MFVLRPNVPFYVMVIFQPPHHPSQQQDMRREMAHKEGQMRRLLRSSEEPLPQLSTRRVTPLYREIFFIVVDFAHVTIKIRINKLHTVYLYIYVYIKALLILNKNISIDTTSALYVETNR